MINLSDENKKMIHLGLKKYFKDEFDYSTLNEFERDIYGKKVNLIMDGELYSDSLLQDDALNITVNGALFKFINKGINIDYIYSSFGNEIFIKNLLSNIVNSTIGTNKIKSLVVDTIKLGDPDDTGRRKPEIQKNSEFNIKADIVIKALGFDPENLPTLFGSEDLQVTRWGTLKTDFDTMETNLPGVFAAGDIIRGASLVVWAIKDGRDAALSIKKFLENKKIEKQKVA